ncbi:hypothetical protein CPB85DRAFT_836553 [Mucidula mucida]|nr:hypothetical protein CPB85DRAFT_836553 [Mucidula mucida]
MPDDFVQHGKQTQSAEVRPRVVGYKFQDAALHGQHQTHLQTPKKGKPTMILESPLTIVRAQSMVRRRSLNCRHWLIMSSAWPSMHQWPAICDMITREVSECECLGRTSNQNLDAHVSGCSSSSTMPSFGISSRRSRSPRYFERYLRTCSLMTTRRKSRCCTQSWSCPNWRQKSAGTAVSRIQRSQSWRMYGMRIDTADSEI